MLEVAGGKFTQPVVYLSPSLWCKSESRLSHQATDRDADEIIDVLEKIDNVLDKDNISLVKIDDEGAEDQYGLSELPALVYLQSGIPNMYQGSELRECSVDFDCYDSTLDSCDRELKSTYANVDLS